MNRRVKKLLILFIFGNLICSGRVFGQLAGNPENFCRNGAFPRESEDYRLARITGKKGEKIYFYGDGREDCPGGKDCRLKSYLVPGDSIIVSRSLGDYSCGWFQPAAGSETVGWIESAKLERVETDRNPADRDWLGEWRFYDNSLVISKGRQPGSLKVTGDAFWKGLGDNVHVGQLDYSGAPSGGQLEVGGEQHDEYACRVTMHLVGRFLIVADNLNCGGANVTFSGVYQRKAKK